MIGSSRYSPSNPRELRGFVQAAVTPGNRLGHLNGSFPTVPEALSGSQGAAWSGLGQGPLPAMASRGLSLGLPQRDPGSLPLDLV